jgi:hypothetical protein
MVWLTVVLCLVTGTAMAEGYEKSVVKLVQKNPGLAPEIVEALKNCELVRGMTEEQATLVGKRWNQMSGGERMLGIFHPGINRSTKNDDQGQKLVEVTFYRDVALQTTGGVARGGEQTVVFLTLYFTNNSLTKWVGEGAGEMKPDTRAKIRREIEKGLAKPGVNK